MKKHSIEISIVNLCNEKFLFRLSIFHLFFFSTDSIGMRQQQQSGNKSTQANQLLREIFAEINFNYSELGPNINFLIIYQCIFFS